MRKLREAAKMTLDQLSACSRVSVGTIRRIEGGMDARVSTLILLLDALQATDEQRLAVLRGWAN